MNAFRRKTKDAVVATEPALEGHEDLAVVVAEKNQWQKIWPILAAGSGLFSEGYVQSVCSRWLLCLTSRSTANIRKGHRISWHHARANLWNCL